MEEQKKMEDPKQYCKYLSKPPEANIEYVGNNSDKLYICALTNIPCMARELEDKTTDNDIVQYAIPTINREEIENCALHNLSLKTAKSVMIENINAKRDKEISELAQRIYRLG